MEQGAEEKPEVRVVYYDWQAELPTGLWAIGIRNVRMRTHVKVRGFDRGDAPFLVQRHLGIERHEVNPEDWVKPPTAREVAS